MTAILAEPHALAFRCRSEADEYFGGMRARMGPVNEFLKGKNLSDREIVEIAHVGYSSWREYEWESAFLRQKVKRGVGYSERLDSFRTISGCVARYCSEQLRGRALQFFLEATSREELGNALVVMSPGDERERLPIGLAGLSGLCALLDLARIVELCVDNFHLAEGSRALRQGRRFSGGKPKGALSPLWRWIRDEVLPNCEEGPAKEVWKYLEAQAGKGVVVRAEGFVLWTTFLKKPLTLANFVSGLSRLKQPSVRKARFAE